MKSFINTYATHWQLYKLHLFFNILDLLSMVLNLDVTQIFEIKKKKFGVKVYFKKNLF